MDFFDSKKDLIQGTRGVNFIEIAKLRRRIKKELNDDARLIDEYFLTILKRMSAPSPLEVINMGSSAFREYETCCRRASVLLEQDGGVYFENALGYIPFKIHKVINNFAGDVSDDIENSSVYNIKDMEVRGRLEALIQLDTFYEDNFETLYFSASEPFLDGVDEQRSQIVKIVGESLMEEFEAAIKSAWYPLTPPQLFRLGFVNEALKLAVISRQEIGDMEYILAAMENLLNDKEEDFENLNDEPVKPVEYKVDRRVGPGPMIFR